MFDDASLPQVIKAATGVINKFQDKVSSAVGAAYKPIGIRRVAKAEADAAMITLLGEQATERQRRAFQRMIAEEDRKQANMEAIAEKAAEQLADSGKPEDLSEDWLVNFFDKASKISDEQMQSMWAKVLAGEANRPGTFTKIALQTLSVLEKTDAEKFVQVCRFSVGAFGPIIFNPNDEIYKRNGVDFATLSHLDDLGLISFNHVSSYIRQGLSREFYSFYGPAIWRMQMPEGMKELPAGRVILTRVGEQLRPLSNAQIVDGFMRYAIDQWTQHGIKITPIAV